MLSSKFWNVKPSSTTKRPDGTILFDSTSRIPLNPRFGYGIIALKHTEADEQWWSENAPSSAKAYFAEAAWAFDPDSPDPDELARDYEHQELAEMGLLPMLSGGFLGHPA